MKKISIIIIISLILCGFGCQRSLMVKKQDESLTYVKKEKSLLHRASRDVELEEYAYLQDNYTFTNNSLYYNALKIHPFPWQNFEHINVSIKNVYTVQTPVIDSFLTGTLFAISSAVIARQMYKGNLYRIPPSPEQFNR